MTETTPYRSRDKSAREADGFSSEPLRPQEGIFLFTRVNAIRHQFMELLEPVARGL